MQICELLVNPGLKLIEEQYSKSATLFNIMFLLDYYPDQSLCQYASLVFYFMFSCAHSMHRYCEILLPDIFHLLS